MKNFQSQPVFEKEMFQLSQKSRKIEHELEVHWSLESQRRIDCEVQRMRDQMLHECENDIKLVGKHFVTPAPQSVAEVAQSKNRVTNIVLFNLEPQKIVTRVQI